MVHGKPDINTQENVDSFHLFDEPVEPQPQTHFAGDLTSVGKTQPKMQQLRKDRPKHPTTLGELFTVEDIGKPSGAPLVKQPKNTHSTANPVLFQSETVYSPIEDTVPAGQVSVSL